MLKLISEILKLSGPKAFGKMCLLSDIRSTVFVGYRRFLIFHTLDVSSRLFADKFIEQFEVDCVTSTAS